MSDRKLKVGMIGAGFIGQLAHLNNYVKVKDCSVVALAEHRPLLRQKVAKHYNIPRTYDSHHKLLDDPEIEAVVIVTPRQYTAPIALDCLKAGLHVMTEKPMAGTLTQAEMLLDIAESKDLHYSVGYMKRYDEGVQRAKRILDSLLNSEELGQLLFARAHCYMGDSYCNPDGQIVTNEQVDYLDSGWPTAPDWLPEERADEFAFFNNTYSHNTNLIRYFFGGTPSVESVWLGNQKIQITVLSYGNFVVSLETGQSSHHGWDEVTEIFFENGCLSIHTPPALLKNITAKVQLYKGGDIQEINTLHCGWSWSFRRQAESFVSDLLEENKSIVSANDAIEDIRLIEEMWRMEINRKA